LPTPKAVENKVNLIKIFKGVGLKKNFLDLVLLIRSIQRSNGNSDCFRRGRVDCKDMHCEWRQYCLTPSHKNSNEELSSPNEEKV